MAENFTSLLPDSYALLEQMHREIIVFDVLMQIEALAVDPEMVRVYRRDRQTDDTHEQIQAELAYARKALSLSKEGRMTDVRKLREKAQRLSELTDVKELQTQLETHQSEFLATLK